MHGVRQEPGKPTPHVMAAEDGSWKGAHLPAAWGLQPSAPALLEGHLEKHSSFWVGAWGEGLVWAWEQWEGWILALVAQVEMGFDGLGPRQHSQ